MPGIFSQRKANKSRLKIANYIQDIASIVTDDELKSRLLFIRDKSLRQNALHKNWEAIDNELFRLLYGLSNHVNKHNTNTINIFLGHIDKLIDAKASRDQYIQNQQETALFELRVQLNEIIDETRRLMRKNADILRKLGRLSPTDPLRLVLDADKKTCESNYRDATAKMKHLAELIAEISTRLTPEDVSFYRNLHELQGVPEELEDRTAEYLFYQTKLSSTVRTSQAVNDSRHENYEPIPTLTESVASHHVEKLLDENTAIVNPTEKQMESDA